VKVGVIGEGLARPEMGVGFLGRSEPPRDLGSAVSSPSESWRSPGRPVLSALRWLPCCCAIE